MRFNLYDSKHQISPTAKQIFSPRPRNVIKSEKAGGGDTGLNSKVTSTEKRSGRVWWSCQDRANSQDALRGRMAIQETFTAHSARFLHDILQQFLIFTKTNFSFGCPLEIRLKEFKKLSSMQKP